jgi:hypothetical protein
MEKHNGARVNQFYKTVSYNGGISLVPVTHIYTPTHLIPKSYPSHKASNWEARSVRHREDGKAADRTEQAPVDKLAFVSDVRAR